MTSIRNKGPEESFIFLKIAFIYSEQSLNRLIYVNFLLDIAFPVNQNFSP